MSSPWETQASNSSGGSGEVPPPGNHPATLIGLIDLGTHVDEYEGKETRDHKALFCWELSGEIKADGTPHVLTQELNFMEKIGTKSKLRVMLQAWRGRPMEDGEALDLMALLGKGCLLNVGHKKSAKGNDYATILGISPPVKGMTIPRPHNDVFEWHFGGGQFVAPAWLPYLYGEPVATRIGLAEENKGRSIPAVAPTPARTPEPVGVGAGVNGTADDSDDPIPF